MLTWIRRLVATAIFTAAMCSPPSEAGVIRTVFDNTTQLGSAFFGPSCCQIGDEITLAGHARNIVQLSLMVSTQNSSQTAVVGSSIYSNDGAGGRPKTLLWQSGLLTVNLAASDAIIDFAVPNVVVPDTITVTSQILSSSPVGLGRYQPGAPAVGTIDGTWIEADWIGPGVWVSPGFDFAVRVFATEAPEPPSGWLIVTALVIMGWSCRRRA